MSEFEHSIFRHLYFDFGLSPSLLGKYLEDREPILFMFVIPGH